MHAGIFFTLLIVLSALAWILRFKIDNFFFQLHCKRIARRLILSTRQSEVQQLLETHNCCIPNLSDEGWQYTIRLTSRPTDSWPEFLYKVDQSVRARVFDGYPKDKSKESWYTYAHNRSGDLSNVVEMIMDVRLR